MLGKMGRNGHQDTIAEARKRFADHCSGTKALPADLRAAVSKPLNDFLITNNFLRTPIRGRSSKGCDVMSC